MERCPPTAERLRSAGLRVTAQRGAVLETLEAAAQDQEHPTVATLTERVRQRLGVVSTQTVYDCLDALNGVGLVDRVDLPGHPTRYELRVGDNHHHLVCRSCGLVRDVDCVMGAAPCLHPSAEQGFAVEHAEVVFWGLCSACGNTADHPSDEDIEEGSQYG